MNKSNKTTEARHTAGAWWRSQNAEDAWEVGAGDEVLAVVRRKAIVRGIKRSGDDESNARLIAAAPEMAEIMLEVVRSDGRCRVDAWQAQFERILKLAGGLP